MRVLRHFLPFSLLFLVLLVPTVSAGIPDSLRNALADACDCDTDTAGFLLGFVIIFVAFMLGVLIMRYDSDWHVLLMLSIFGLALSIGIGWWPAWTAIIVVIALAVLLIGMPGVSKE